MTFITAHKDRADGGLRWGVESICTVLNEHGVGIAPSTYYDARDRRPSAREERDEELKQVILDTWEGQRRRLGARKLWLRLRRNGVDIARCTVERLMRELGLTGVTRGTRRHPADTGAKETRPADLVDRHFARFRTDELWVADFPYVWTWSGWVDVAFVFDAHSRRLLGWRAATSMATPPVLDCHEMALFTRHREGVAGFAGLTHHTDPGSVYKSIAFTERLAEEGIDASVGSVADAYGNSLAASQIGLYKSELIHHEGPWRDVAHVEAATAEGVAWFNAERMHGSLDDLTPLEVEQIDYAHNGRRKPRPDTSKKPSGHAGASHPSPEPSYVAGYKQWQALGRQVERGQPGYMIFAPVTGRFASINPADPESRRRVGRFEKPKPGEVVRSRMVGAKPAYVWDVSQTSGDAVPERPTPTLLEGQAPAGLWEELAALVEAEGFAVVRVEHEGMIRGANGLTDYANRTVAVRTDMDDGAGARRGDGHRPRRRHDPREPVRLVLR